MIRLCDSSVSHGARLVVVLPEVVGCLEGWAQLSLDHSSAVASEWLRTPSEFHVHKRICVALMTWS